MAQMNVKRWRRAVVALLVTGAFAHQATGVASAAVAPEGQYQGPSYAGSASSPTGSSPRASCGSTTGPGGRP